MKTAEEILKDKVFKLSNLAGFEVEVLEAMKAYASQFKSQPQDSGEVKGRNLLTAGELRKQLEEEDSEDIKMKGDIFWFNKFNDLHVDEVSEILKSGEYDKYLESKLL